jgi:hypothetical protein
MKKGALFTLRQGHWFEAILVSIPFCMFLIIAGQIVWAILVYGTVFWLYRTFAFRFLRITRRGVVGFRFRKPFRKTYGYFYADIAQVYIPIPGRGGWEMEFKFKDGASFTSKVTDNIDVICRYFIDRRIPVASGSSYIRNIITQHLARPQIDPHKQIALRKAREAARKIKLRKMRGI